MSIKKLLENEVGFECTTANNNIQLLIRNVSLFCKKVNLNLRKTLFSLVFQNSFERLAGRTVKIISLLSRFVKLKSNIEKHLM